jgi:hypothetical protein
MANHNKSDTFTKIDLNSLIEGIQAGDKQAEKKLEKLILPIILNWEDALRKLNLEDQDAIQEIKFRLIKQLRKRPQKIDDPKAYISTVAHTFIFGANKKASAEKRGGYIEEEIETGKKKRRRICVDSLEARNEKARESGQPAPLEGEQIFGENDASLEEIVERRDSRGADIIRDSYMNLPEDLRAGIEKSLDIIADLFRMRSFLQGKLKRDSHHDKQILKPIKLIAEARKLIGKMRGHDPQDPDLLRLRELREMPGPALSGRPEEDKKHDEWLTELKSLEAKYGVALDLYEAQIDLSAEILNTETDLRLSPAGLLDFESSYWIDHLSEIAGMKVSPPSIIYKVWSKAPGFSTGRLKKYRSRERIAIAFRYHKIASKGTQGEFLFQSIGDVREIKDPEKLITILERFRKAGYGQALQKKYKPIIKLIYEKSFLTKA